MVIVVWVTMGYWRLSLGAAVEVRSRLETANVLLSLVLSGGHDELFSSASAGPLGANPTEFALCAGVGSDCGQTQSAGAGVLLLPFHFARGDRLPFRGGGQ